MDRMIFFGEASLRTAVQNFMEHYHSERNHQGLANRIICPEADHREASGAIQRRQRLVGIYAPEVCAAPGIGASAA